MPDPEHFNEGDHEIDPSTAAKLQEIGDVARTLVPFETCLPEGTQRVGAAHREMGQGTARCKYTIGAQYDLAGSLQRVRVDQAVGPYETGAEYDWTEQEVRFYKDGDNDPYSIDKSNGPIGPGFIALLHMFMVTANEVAD